MIGIISHDAGGAEILASYVSKNDSRDFTFALDGPAETIFQNRLGKIDNTSLDYISRTCDWCLCGTSWQSDLEWRAIEEFQLLGKRVVAFLDHWVNYRERFIRNGHEHLPDEIWVGDAEAKSIATKLFPGLPIELVRNPIFDDQKAELRELSRKYRSPSDGINILFISDNVAESMLKQHGDERHWGYTDKDTLEYFLDNINFLYDRINKVVIRPHPSESGDNYTQIIRERVNIAELGGRLPLLEEIAISDVVVGSESMAMVIAMLGGKRVISCIPPGGKLCSLPFLKIERLNELV